jgi:integrase
MGTLDIAITQCFDAPAVRARSGHARWLYLIGVAHCQAGETDEISVDTVEGWLRGSQNGARWEHVTELLLAALWEKVTDRAFRLLAPPAVNDRPVLRVVSVSAESVATPSAVAESTQDWTTVVDAFLNSHLDSRSTRMSYRATLRAAFGFFGVDQLDQLTGLQLSAYRAQVLALPLAPKTKANRLIALRSLLRWAYGLGVHGLSRDLVELALRVPHATVITPFEALTDTECSALLGAARSLRNRAVIVVALGAGLRASEICALTIGDFRDGEVPYLFVRQGKGRKDRIVPVREDTAAVVRAVMGNRDASAPLIPSHGRFGRGPGGCLNRQIVGAIVTETARLAGLSGRRVTPHSIRHTYANRARQGGSDVVAISKLLGHANLQTTMTYLDHLELADLAAAAPGLPLPDAAGLRQCR